MEMVYKVIKFSTKPKFGSLQRQLKLTNFCFKIGEESREVYLNAMGTERKAQLQILQTLKIIRNNLNHVCQPI